MILVPIESAYACDFLLVGHCDYSPILHRFWDLTAFMYSWPHPYSTLNLGVIPLHQIAHVGVIKRMGLKLFGREIIFEVFQPMWKSHPNVTARQTDRQTDGQTTYCRITALCIASRGNEHKYFFTFLASVIYGKSRLETNSDGSIQSYTRHPLLHALRRQTTETVHAAIAKSASQPVCIGGAFSLNWTLHDRWSSVVSRYSACEHRTGVLAVKELNGQYCTLL